MDEEKQAGGDSERQADMLAELMEITQAAATIGAKAAKAIKGVTPENEETKAEREKRLNAKYQADFRKREAEKEAVRKAAEATVREQLLKETNDLREKAGLPKKPMPSPDKVVSPDATAKQTAVPGNSVALISLGVVIAVLLLLNLLF